MNIKDHYVYIGIAILVALVAAYFLFPRRSDSEGFQSPSTPAALVGDPETCKIMKNIITGTTAKLTDATDKNDPTNIKLFKTTLESLQEQYAALRCS